MIVSASRRTDIPSCYADWFFNRVEAGFVDIRNPMNFNQTRRVALTPGAVDGIVFWTKNPAPMLNRLGLLREYQYYFQFTVTPYGRDIEPAVPHKSTETIQTFQRLSDIIGAGNVIWRYDPILLSAKYTIDYHTRAFEKIAKALHCHTHKVTVSFIDSHYKSVKNNMDKLGLVDFTQQTRANLASTLAAIAQSYGLAIDACAEEADLQSHGIGAAACVDPARFKNPLSQDPLSQKIKKDKNQRKACGCASSIDIGMYNTCINGCLYCYANYIQKASAANYVKHNYQSSFLVDGS